MMSLAFLRWQHTVRTRTDILLWELGSIVCSHILYVNVVVTVRVVSDKHGVLVGRRIVLRTLCWPAIWNDSHSNWFLWVPKAVNVLRMFFVMLAVIHFRVIQLHLSDIKIRKKFQHQRWTFVQKQIFQSIYICISYISKLHINLRAFELHVFYLFWTHM